MTDQLHGYCDISVNRREFILSDKEQSAFLTVLPYFTDYILDYIRIAYSFRELNQIDDRELKILINIVHNQTDFNNESLMVSFFSHVVQMVRFKDIITVLLRTGHNQLGMRLHIAKDPTSVAGIDRSESRDASSVFIFNFYYRIKTNVDNETLTGSRVQSLREMIARFSDKLSSETNTGNRQDHVDRIGSLYVMLVLQYRTAEERRTILREMKAIVPAELDSNTVDIIFHSKMSLTEFLAGLETEVESHARRAIMIRDSCTSEFGATLIFHDQIYIARMRYQKTGNEEDLSRLIEMYDTGQQRLRNDKVEVQNQWRRIVILFVVMSLLGIRSDFALMVHHNMREEYVTQASHLLEELSEISENIEARRSMILALCRARVQEARKNVQMCIDYLKLALFHADDGGTFFDIEKENIAQYHRRMMAYNAALVRENCYGVQESSP